MTEKEWLNCTDLEKMMEFVEWRVSERKLILFGCACCYRQWSVIPKGTCKKAVETAERFADGLSGPIDLRLARERVEQECPHLFWYQDFGCHAEAASYFATFDEVAAREMEADHPLDRPGHYLAILKRVEVAGGVAMAISRASPTGEVDWDREAAAQCDILRDILGNSFRSVSVDHDWLRPEVIPLAQAAYGGRELPGGHLSDDRLAILADALEEAGCTNAAILHHLRSPGPHFRGCWVVDLILSKDR